MIIDTLDNAEKYTSLHKDFAKGFEYISHNKNAEAGKYKINDELNASVSNKEGTTADAAKFEAHDHNIDIQVCLSGKEKMGWKPRSKCSHITTPYNPEKDVTFFGDEPDMYFELTDNQFAIFFPEDVHAPMIGEGEIKKLVMKVRI